MNPKNKNQTLLTLTSSALLLPVYQGAHADAPPDYAEFGVRYSTYEEDDTSEHNTFGGSSERYQIDISQAHLLTPVGDNWSLAFDVQKEHMSGASPWFIGPSVDGDPQIFMSGASIRDTRTDISVTTRYYFDRGNVGVNYARSDEDDYESDALALDVAFNSNDGMSTYSAAISASDDTLEPTQGVIPTKVTKEDKDMRSAHIGMSRILGKTSIVQFGLGYIYFDGYLTDPYKLNDRRPDERKEFTFSSGYRHFFSAQNL